MRLILFSGMGGDRRLCEPLGVPGVTLVAPDHAPAKPRETLAEYAARLAEDHRVGEGDVVGGVSFGGMIAAEISKRRKTAGLVLLGSCIRPRLLPASYRWLEKIGPLIPDLALHAREVGPLLRWRFAPLTPEAEATMRAMSAVYPVGQIRDFSRMLFGWDGLEQPPCPVLSIHGDMDRIIPLSAAEPGVVLEKAGHAFTLTHAEQTAMHVTAFLAGLP